MQFSSHPCAYSAHKLTILLLLLTTTAEAERLGDSGQGGMSAAIWFEPSICRSFLLLISSFSEAQVVDHLDVRDSERIVLSRHILGRIPCPSNSIHWAASFHPEKLSKR